MRNEIIIEVAKPGDEKEIESLASSVKIGKNDEKGFLVYPVNARNYRTRIILTPYFYVAREKKIIGYIMAYDKKAIEKLKEMGELSHEDELVKSVEKKAFNRFIFIDQIAIGHDFCRRGIGSKLLEFLIKNIKGKYKVICCGVILSPVQNNAGRNFFVKHGFKLLKKIELENHGYGCGIFYRKV